MVFKCGQGILSVAGREQVVSNIICCFISYTKIPPSGALSKGCPQRPIFFFPHCDTPTPLLFCIGSRLKGMQSHLITLISIGEAYTLLLYVCMCVCLRYELRVLLRVRGLHAVSCSCLAAHI